jgi:predicted nucleic acid-binding protein
MTPKSEDLAQDVPVRPPLYGIDSRVFVYHFEAHQELGPAAGRLLEAAEGGRCRLVCSVLAQLEVLVVPKRNQRQDLCARYREVFESFPNLSVLNVDREIAEIASDLRAAYSLRTPDAIHLATALRAGASAFVSQDGRLKLSELPILRMDQVPLQHG